MMSTPPPVFLVEPFPDDVPLNRHLFRDRFDSDLKYDPRLPEEHGGSATRDQKPVVPVASWLLARLASLVGSRFQATLTINQDREAVFQFAGRSGGELLGPVCLTFTSSGEVRGLFQALDVDGTSLLFEGLRNALLSSPSELAAISIEFPDGEQFGWGDGCYHGRIAPEFNAAELVEKLITGELVEKLPDDRVELCPIGIDRIAGTLSDPRKPLTASRVRYLQSAGLGDVRAWVFKVSRRDLYAVVVWPEKGQPEIQVVG